MDPLERWIQVPLLGHINSDLQELSYKDAVLFFANCLFILNCNYSVAVRNKLVDSPFITVFIASNAPTPFLASVLI